MIRLALRQFRASALIAIGALVAVAVVVIATKPHLQDVYDTTVKNCSDRGDCDRVVRNFMNTDRILRGWLGLLVVVTPGLIGVFWGAPLVARELETGTFRLAWTQGVTRTRWLLTKVALVGAASALTAGLVSLAVSWWSGLFDRVGEVGYGVFDQRDIVPIGHALFGFALGVAAGMLWRRVLPALATTLVVFVVVRVGMSLWVRPHLLGPKVMTSAIHPERTGFGSENGGAMTLRPDGPHLPNAWIHSVDLLDSSGKAITPEVVAASCPDLAAPPPPTGPRTGTGRASDEFVDALHSCVAKLGRTYHEVTTYHPADRYWPLQWLELGIYAAAAVVVVAGCVGWLRRRAA